MAIEEGEAGQLIFPKGMDEYLEYARKLVEEKEYFGAFARIHALIEFWMQDLFEQDYQTSHSDDELTKLVSESGPKAQYRFSRLVEALTKRDLLTPDEAKRLKDFNLLRDRILHRLVKYSFQTYPWHVVMRSEAEGEFEEGVKLAKLMEAKCGGQWIMVTADKVITFSRRSPKQRRYGLR